MVPAIFYSGIFSGIYGLILASNLTFSSNDILMGFLLGVPQLAFGFICVTIGTKTTKAIIKNKDLIKSICQISFVSKERIIRPPQLKKKPPNKQSI